MKRSYKNQIVWIIGASSGIGLALAKKLSASGAILALSARNLNKLKELQTEIGKAHKVFALDTTDIKLMVKKAREIKKAFGRIDRVIFLAAAYKPMKLDSLDMESVKTIIDVNITGAFNLIQAILPIFKTQKVKGQIALCGSVAGYIGLPGGQPYSATKAAIINLAETLYAEVGNTIDIKLISPGFVRTPMTEKNKFEMPMLMEPKDAASAIAKGLLGDAFEVHFPKKFTFFLKILHLLPYWLMLRLTKKIKT